MKVKCLQFLSSVGLLFLQANSLVYQGKDAYNFWIPVYNYKASIIVILIMLALNNINYKAKVRSCYRVKPGGPKKFLLEVLYYVK